MDDKVTLLPCPFCGGKASASGKTHFTLKEPDAWWNDGTPIIDAFFCNCTRCGITNQTIVGGYQTQAMAIAEWNRRQAQEAPKAASQSAEELVRALRGCDHMDGDWDLRDDEAITRIEADRAAQRQAGREEAEKEYMLKGWDNHHNAATCPHCNHGLKHTWAEYEAMAKHYAVAVEALEEILPVEGTGEGLAPYYIHSDTITRARKALSDLDKARKG